MAEPEPFVDGRVMDLLQALGLQAHWHLFQRAEVRLEHLPRLTDEGLRRLGLEVPEERRRLLQATSALLHLSTPSAGLVVAAPPSAPLAPPASSGAVGPGGARVGALAPGPSAAPSPASDATSGLPPRAAASPSGLGVVAGVLAAAAVGGGAAWVLLRGDPPPVDSYAALERGVQASWEPVASPSTGPGSDLEPPASPNSPRTPVDITASATTRVSSVLPPEHGATFGPESLVDGDLETCWQPHAKETHGVGEWASFSFERPHVITRIAIANGFQRHFHGNDLFLDNARADRIEADFGDTKMTLRLKPEARGFLRFTLAAPVVTQQLTLHIRGVQPGGQWPDVALSEVRLYGYAQE
jgi:hypothetical protein